MATLAKQNVSNEYVIMLIIVLFMKNVLSKNNQRENENGQNAIFSNVGLASYMELFYREADFKVYYFIT